ncbi:MAG: hypothetical protein ACE5GE_15115, partial [Phycisphaerae bacterium]
MSSSPSVIDDPFGQGTALAEPAAPPTATIPHRPPPPVPAPSRALGPTDLQRILKLPVPVIV